jgi:hypothetical protein
MWQYAPAHVPGSDGCAAFDAALLFTFSLENPAFARESTQTVIHAFRMCTGGFQN